MEALFWYIMILVPVLAWHRDLSSLKNAVEAGIYDVWERLSTGRLKVFRTLQNWQAEYRLYRRDENGAVVKMFDHLMDDTRYMMLSGRAIAIVEPKGGSKMPTQSYGDPVLNF